MQKKDNTLCINLDSIKTSDKSTYIVTFNEESISNNTSKNINVGNNTLSISVVAENEGKRVYTFNINRKDVDKKDNEIITDNKTNDEITNNINTGDGLIIGIFTILVLSIGITMYLCNKNKLFNK